MRTIREILDKYTFPKHFLVEFCYLCVKDIALTDADRRGIALLKKVQENDPAVTDTMLRAAQTRTEGAIRLALLIARTDMMRSRTEKWREAYASDIPFWVNRIVTKDCNQIFTDLFTARFSPFERILLNLPDHL